MNALNTWEDPTRTTARPPRFGWPGRGAGAATVVQPAPTWNGTSQQVCGFFPFAVGAGNPMIGVPVGRNLITGATVCCDPISWFQRAHLINNPSMFVLGLPAFGKSTWLRRQLAGLTGYGVLPMVLGDLKPDFVPIVRALDGQVISIGPGRGHLNVLDPGESKRAADLLVDHPQLRAQVLEDARSRRLTMVTALLAISRGVSPSDREEAILSAALDVLEEQHSGIPVLADLLKVVQEGPEAVRLVAVDRGSMSRYQEITENLEASLIALTHSRLGQTFGHQTSEPMQLDRPIVFDVSGIDESDTKLRAAALLACWSTGFAAVDVAQVLADAGLAPRRHRMIFMDEIWMALRSGPGMVDRVDAVTRLNRAKGVGQAMCSHTMTDMLALPDAADRMKARGFVERAGIKVLGALPPAEMPHLRTVMSLSKAEEQLLVGWSDPAAWNKRPGQDTAPPGRGKFLIKVGNRAGIPVQLELTAHEVPVNDTNQRWHDLSRIAATPATQALADVLFAVVDEQEARYGAQNQENPA